MMKGKTLWKTFYPSKISIVQEINFVQENEKEFTELSGWPAEIWNQLASHNH